VILTASSEASCLGDTPKAQIQESMLRSNTFDWAAAHRAHSGWDVRGASVFQGASASVGA
jgi:hypothetical protein